MTEASENGYLVRVRAQVMCRDEGTGGWMALGGGGLADVMVCRRGPGGADNGDTALSAANILQTEYYIHGRRINDNTLVLDCTVKDDFHYHKVMPTFHHWVSDGKRYGLTFQTAADARHFDKGVRVAVNHLYRKRNLLKPKEDDEENNIFECLNLPSESRSSSETSTASRRRDEPSQTPILSAITLPRHPLTVYVDDVIGVTDSLNLQYDDKLDDSENDRCPYVHLSAVHEYTYPAVCPGGVTGEEKSSPNTKAPPLGRDSGSMRKVRGPPPLPDKKLPPEAFRARLKCRHCHEWYLESANRAGACEFAPDLCRACVDGASCVKCAQCMLYHCMSDAEGDFASQPCACGPPGDACAKRWAGVALLSLLVPCLCCYLPLRCAHAAARRAGLAGGAHEPVRQ